MKYIKIIAIAVAFILLLTLAACSAKPVIGTTTASPTAETTASPTVVPTVLPTAAATASPVSVTTTSPTHASGQIYLYGEQHAVAKILDKEFQLWRDAYHNKNMRHLFVEQAYFTAEFLNIWMKSDSDDILNMVYDEWTSSPSHNPIIKEFYQKIKKECPETIFHGTDVGHFYETTGARFLKYLKDNKLEGSKQYSLTQDDIEQGRYYYTHSQDGVYRENKMAENFIREIDNLGGIDVMGFYGAAHTGLDANDLLTNTVPCMANQLKRHYGDAVHSEDLSSLAKATEPDRVDTINVGGKDYKASYFGIQDLTSMTKEYASREFWRLENAYDDFKNNPKTNDGHPYSDYPMKIETGQVFVVKYLKKDGSVMTLYYRSDGAVWNGQPVTEGFAVS